MQARFVFFLSLFLVLTALAVFAFSKTALFVAPVKVDEKANTWVKIGTVEIRNGKIVAANFTVETNFR